MLNNREITPLTPILGQQNPLISVIIPLFNKRAYLKEALESVLNQNYPNLEILIRDDGSSDDSLLCAQALKEQFSNYNIQIFSGPNMGAAYCRNFLIEKASSRLVMLMDADDLMLPGFFAEALQVMRDHGAHVVYSDVEVFGEKNTEWCPPKFDRYLIKYDNCLTSLALFDKDLWTAVGGYNNALPFNEDWSFFINIAQVTDKFYKIPKKYFRYRHTNTGLYYSYVLDNWSLNLSLVIVSNPDLYSVSEVLKAVENLKTMPDAWQKKFENFHKKHEESILPAIVLGIFAEGKKQEQAACDKYTEAVKKSEAGKWLPLWLLARLIRTSDTSNCIAFLHRVRTLRADSADITNPLINELLGQTNSTNNLEEKEKSLERPPTITSKNVICGINENSLNFWRMRKYHADEVDQVCKEIDSKFMAARVAFDGTGDVKVAISTKTWERQEGHYPTICDFFGEVARSEQCKNLKGSFIVWLEDGLWEYQNHLASRAPIVSFGRHIHDQKSFLMPDPSFLGYNGYLEDRETMIEWESEYQGLAKEKKIFWRGAATGIGIEAHEWGQTPRGRLVLLAKQLNNTQILDAKITKYKHLPEQQIENLKIADVLDEPCDFKEFLKYKYVIDADGYCCAWQSLFLKLMSSSLTMKIQSPYEQWYFHELKPWVNYVPVDPELKDLVEIYEWLLEHDQETLKIVQAANQLTKVLTYQKELGRVSSLSAELLACQK